MSGGGGPPGRAAPPNPDAPATAGQVRQMAASLQASLDQLTASTRELSETIRACFDEARAALAQAGPWPGDARWDKPAGDRGPPGPARPAEAQWDGPADDWGPVGPARRVRAVEAGLAGLRLDDHRIIGSPGDPDQGEADSDAGS
jgi:hypothetical protein